MSPASERADRSPEEPDRAPDKPGLAYPTPKNRLEFSAYRFHVVARYLDDVKNSTAQLVRAIIFLWAAFIIPLILLYFAVTRYDGLVLPFDWKWLTAVGCLGSIAIGAIGRRRSKRRRVRGAEATDRPDSTPDAVETGLDGFVQIAAESADGN